jgi:hypothetical protein
LATIPTALIAGYGCEPRTGNCQNLALGGDLMFHHINAPPRMQEILW